MFVGHSPFVEILLAIFVHIAKTISVISRVVVTIVITVIIVILIVKCIISIVIVSIVIRLERSSFLFATDSFLKS